MSTYDAPVRILGAAPLCGVYNPDQAREQGYWIIPRADNEQLCVPVTRVGPPIARLQLGDIFMGLVVAEYNSARRNPGHREFLVYGPAAATALRGELPRSQWTAAMMFAVPPQRPYSGDAAAEQPAPATPHTPSRGRTFAEADGTDPTNAADTVDGVLYVYGQTTAAAILTALQSGVHVDGTADILVQRLRGVTIPIPITVRTTIGDPSTYCRNGQELRRRLRQLGGSRTVRLSDASGPRAGGPQTELEDPADAHRAILRQCPVLGQEHILMYLNTTNDGAARSLDFLDSQPRSHNSWVINTATHLQTFISWVERFNRDTLFGVTSQHTVAQPNFTGVFTRDRVAEVVTWLRAAPTTTWIRPNSATTLPRELLEMADTIRADLLRSITRTWDIERLRTVASGSDDGGITMLQQQMAARAGARLRTRIFTFTGHIPEAEDQEVASTAPPTFGNIPSIGNVSDEHATSQEAATRRLRSTDPTARSTAESLRHSSRRPPTTNISRQRPAVTGTGRQRLDLNRTSGTWESADGRIININEMDQRHLHNTICYLIRNVELVHRESNDPDQTSLPKCWLRDRPLFRALLHEALRRNQIFPDDVFQYIRDYMLGANGDIVIDTAEPWNNAQLGLVQRPVLAEAQQALQRAAEAEAAARNYGRPLRHLDLDTPPSTEGDK